MFKKSQKFDTELYCVFDKVAASPLFFLSARSDGLAVRRCMLSLSVPLKDTQIFSLGGFLNESDLKSFVPGFREVPWSAYRLPETLAESVSPLNLTEDEFKEFVSSAKEKLEVKENK